jgi:hypothetical protein
MPACGVPSSRGHSHISGMTPPNLTDDDLAELARFLREAIEADRYPFSPRVKQLQGVLEKLAPPRPGLLPKSG